MSCNNQPKRFAYLAGKIKVGHGATEYRALIAPILRKYGIDSLDPLRGKYRLSGWSDLSPNEVVVRDLQDIQRAHVVIAMMMKCEDSSFGTPCEIMYAWLKQIPVVMITDEAYLMGHFWTRSLCSHLRLVQPHEKLDQILIETAQHVGNWYGSNIEEEVYCAPAMNPTITGNTSISPVFDDTRCNPENCAGCEHCQCRICGDSLPCNAHENDRRVS